MFFVLLVLFTTAYALPGGAPPKVCETMLPFHSGGILPQSTSSPYGLAARRNGSGYMITLKSPINLPFEGFMLQARSPSRELIGVFEPNTDLFHTIDCTNARTTLTHSNTEQKPAVEVFWNPNGYEGPVTFNATIAQDYSNFWTGVESSEIQVRPGEGGSSIFPQPTRPITTTPPNFSTTKKLEQSTEFDPFYDGCDVKKSCFGAPAGCIANKNCKVVAAITVYGERYEFELKASQGVVWAAVGLSDDTQMGDDSVIECVKQGDSVKAYLSYTSGRPNYAATRDRKQDQIQQLEGKRIDDGLYCRVLRDTKTKINGKEFDLTKDRYYLVVAAGSSVRENSVNFHDLAYLASGEQKLLSDVSAIKAASKLLVRLHGAFMLAAWIGTASIGVLLARYYRQTWVGSSLCGKDLWFAWHRFFMVLTWALTTAGFILIFVELKAWSTEYPHSILGVVTTALCFMQPIGAYFRPHPGASKRPIFNWVHWLGGNVAHILAIVTIFFAVKLNKADLPEWMDWILVGYVAFHVVMHLLLSFMGCASEKSAERRVNSFPMKDMTGSGRSSVYTDRGADAPFSGVRKFLLAIYIIVIILIVVALIIVTAFAPVEEFWDSIKNSMQ